MLVELLYVVVAKTLDHTQAQNKVTSPENHCDGRPSAQVSAIPAKPISQTIRKNRSSDSFVSQNDLGKSARRKVQPFGNDTSIYCGQWRVSPHDEQE